MGAIVGAAAGYGGRHLLGKLALLSGGLYPVMTLSLGLLAYGVATLVHGSGFLAVYLAGLLLGNGPLPYRTGLLRVHDALAWLSQVGMFLILGLLVYPSRLLEVAWIGLGIALLLALSCGLGGRALACCLFAIRRRGALHGWVGLRARCHRAGDVSGAGRAPGAGRLFDIVFFVVVASALVPGDRGLGDPRLGLQSKEPPAPHAVLAIESRQPLQATDVLLYR